MTDRLSSQKFHHIEFWCGDASNAWRRFSWGLGMHLVAKSDQSTGNQSYCSYVIQSDEVVFSFTAPYSEQIDQSTSRLPHPGFSADKARAFFDKHGLGVRAVGVLVEDAETAFKEAVENGAIGVLEPSTVSHNGPPQPGVGGSRGGGGGKMKLAEVQLYGDTVLRLVSNDGFTGPYLPNFESVESLPVSYGIARIDHGFGIVSALKEAADYIGRFTGFHELGTSTSSERGLNGLVLANGPETVVLSIGEPTFSGTGSKSHVKMFLEHNEGAGLQHLGLQCEDIFSTVKEMRMRSDIGGFPLIPKPPSIYYKRVMKTVGEQLLSTQQWKECEELGILIERDNQGVLLHAFTQPLGDRYTVFFEIMQRIGSRQQSADGRPVRSMVSCSEFC